MTNEQRIDAIIEQVRGLSMGEIRHRLLTAPETGKMEMLYRLWVATSPRKATP